MFQANDKKSYNLYIITNKADFKSQTTADEIINNYIYRFTDSLQFVKACKEKHIGLKLE